jgi:hypothetical protein
MEQCMVKVNLSSVTAQNLETYQHMGGNAEGSILLIRKAKGH